MKIRHPWLIKTLGFLFTLAIRLWVGTLRFRVRCAGREIRPTAPNLAGRYIYAFWHEALLIPGPHFGRPDVHALVSGHSDGRLIAEALRHFRFGLIDGSTNRGGGAAVRQILRLQGRVHITVAPDGPRGPRRRLQPGVVYLASRTGMPIVPVGFGFHSAWRARSWDRLALPVPFSAATCIFGEPIFIPPNADRETLERFVALAQASMDRITAEAEEWANQQSW